jgi:hypothetical protein
MTPQAKKLVTKWDSNGFPDTHFWVCPLCDNVFDKQTDAQNCCSDKRKVPGYQPWFKPSPPIGKLGEGKYRGAKKP